MVNNREQPRKKFDEQALEELADSIRQFGILQPLIVQEKDDYYEIVPGVDSFHPKVVRSSMGALFRLRHAYFNTFEEYKTAYTKDINKNVPIPTAIVKFKESTSKL